MGTVTHGNNGSLYVGANAMAELRSWTLNEEARPADSSVLGAQYDTHNNNDNVLSMPKSWSGEATAFWDPTDTNGQEAMVIGASVTLNLYPAGNTSGKTYKTGTATVTAAGLAVNKAGNVEKTFRFQGNGTLTQSTV